MLRNKKAVLKNGTKNKNFKDLKISKLKDYITSVQLRKTFNLKAA